MFTADQIRPLGATMPDLRDATLELKTATGSGSSDTYAAAVTQKARRRPLNRDELRLPEVMGETETTTFIFWNADPATFVEPKRDARIIDWEGKRWVVRATKNTVMGVYHNAVCARMY